MILLWLAHPGEIIPQPVTLESLFEEACTMGPIEDDMRTAAFSLLLAAEERKDYRYQAEAHYLLGKYYYLRMVKGEGGKHYRKAAQLFTSINNHEKAGLAIERLGMVQLQEGMPDSAMLCFHQVIDIFRQYGLETRLWSPLMNISTVHQRMGNTAEAFRYAKEAAAQAKSLSDRATKALTLIRMMNLSRDHDSLALYAHHADAFYRLYSPLEIDEELISHVGQYHTITDPAARIAAIQSTIDHLSQWPVTLELISSYHQLGQAYAELNYLDQALKAWKAGLKIGMGEPFQHFRPVLLQAIHRTYEKIGDTRNALHYFHQYVTLRDSLKDAWSKARIEELQIQYDTKSKDAQIQNQQFELDRRTQQRNAILLLLAVLIAAGCYAVYNQRRYLRAQQTISMHEKRFHENQIGELKKEHALHTLQTLVTALEEERTRIAQDLHDSLGASLATLRMQIHHMYGHTNAVEMPQVATLLNTLDNVSSEVRRISHNMMPQALISMGLPAALEDLANTIQLSQKLDVSFQNIDYSEPLAQDKEISLYRIAQELCTNTIRHSSANHLLIQLSRHNGSATLVVEDNGKGFNPSTVEETGIGLQNIRSRVTWLSGDIEIISAPGEGASFTIQIPAT
jgi:signal transduction histidine kinase